LFDFVFVFGHVLDFHFLDSEFGVLISFSHDLRGLLGLNCINILFLVCRMSRSHPLSSGHSLLSNILREVSALGFVVRVYFTLAVDTGDSLRRSRFILNLFELLVIKVFRELEVSFVVLYHFWVSFWLNVFIGFDLIFGRRFIALFESDTFGYLVFVENVGIVALLFGISLKLGF